MRRIQVELDNAQVHRTRMLAAFAATVGNDGTVADVMGLNEREVRLARRTVGKEDARSLAAELLRRSTEPPPVPQPENPTAVFQEGVTIPGPRTEPVLPETSAPPSVSPAYATGPVAVESTSPGAATPGTPAGASTTSTASAGGTAFQETEYTPPPSAQQELVSWSPAMDSVLLWSWQSGIDLQAVACELGLDVRALLQRAQTLAAEGRLVLQPTRGDSGQAGRHRRRDDFFDSAPDSPEELYTHAGYVTQPY